MTSLLTGSPWPGLLAWIVLYISDYAFTIACARLYKQQDKILFEGSFEITPYYQEDINALRRLSPRFLRALGTSSVLIVLIWWLTQPPPGTPGLYRLVMGMLLLVEVTVHIRHLRNWHMYTYGIQAMKGRIEYGRAVMLRTSAIEVLLFAGLYAMLSAATGSLFILGGAIACAALGLNHYRLAAKHPASVANSIT